MIYGQDVPIINFLLSKASKTGLAVRFRVTFTEGGDKASGTNWDRDKNGIQELISPEAIVNQRIRRSIRTDGILDCIKPKLTSLIRRVYTIIGIRSGYCFQEISKTKILTY